MARDRSTVKTCLAAHALLEMLEEEDNIVTKRGETRHWIKRKGGKGYFNNIVRELTIAAAETLRFLATGETYRSLSLQFRILRAAISQFSCFQRLLCPFFFYLQRDRLYFFRRILENFPHSSYPILTSTRNARSNYKQ